MDQTNPTSPEVPVSEPEKKDGHWITIAAMALFVAASLIAVGFLYYQNQQLKTMLASYQPQASPTPVATADPTANWKTYTNTQYNYSFKYPPSQHVNDKYATNEIVTGGEKIDDPLYAPMAFTVFDNTRDLSIREWFRTHAPGDKVTENLFRDTLVNGNPAVKYLSEGATVYHYFIQGSKIIISAGPMDQQLNAEVQNKENDLVLSTFKFTGASPSPSGSPIACTQEAKLCPDGSSVGRTGPNCEFAPCPTSY